MTESVGSGAVAACKTADRGRAAVDQVSDIDRSAVRLRAAQLHDDVLAVAEVDVGPAGRRHLAAPQCSVKQKPDERAVDEAAALEAAAGPPRLGAGLQDGGALVGRQPAGLRDC